MTKQSFRHTSGALGATTEHVQPVIRNTVGHATPIVSRQTLRRMHDSGRSNATDQSAKDLKGTQSDQRKKQPKNRNHYDKENYDEAQPLEGMKH